MPSTLAAGCTIFHFCLKCAFNFDYEFKMVKGFWSCSKLSCFFFIVVSWEDNLSKLHVSLESAPPLPLYIGYTSNLKLCINVCTQVFMLDRCRTWEPLDANLDLGVLQKHDSILPEPNFKRSEAKYSLKACYYSQNKHGKWKKKKIPQSFHITICKQTLISHSFPQEGIDKMLKSTMTECWW